MATLALLFCFVNPKIPEEKQKTSQLHSAQRSRVPISLKYYSFLTHVNEYA
jgi:hypothetical protein